MHIVSHASYEHMHATGKYPLLAISFSVLCYQFWLVDPTFAWLYLPFIFHECLIPLWQEKNTPGWCHLNSCTNQPGDIQVQIKRRVKNADLLRDISDPVREAIIQVSYWIQEVVFIFSQRWLEYDHKGAGCRKTSVAQKSTMITTFLSNRKKKKKEQRSEAQIKAHKGLTHKRLFLGQDKPICKVSV